MNSGSRYSLLIPNLKRNSRKRFGHIRPQLTGDSLLDVGAAEGWVGYYAEREIGLRVELLDVVDLNQTHLPHRIYDGFRFPHPDNSFDSVTLLLTLHHCAEPEQVLAEAKRVARQRIVVTESVYHTRPGKAVLTFMDRAYNALRSGGRMTGGLNFKTPPEWRALFCGLNLTLETETWLSRGLHRQKLFVLGPG